MIRARRTTAGDTAPRRGLTIPTIVLLAAIAAVRVPLHDLGMVRQGSAAASLLVFVPLALWVVVVLGRRVPNPFLALLAVGFTYGLMLAGIHQVFWGAAFGGDAPSLGGNLDGVLAPNVEALFLRAASVPGSIATGTILGAATGAAAWTIARLRLS